MDLTTDIIVILAFTSLTGSVTLLVWYIIGGFLAKHEYADMMFRFIWVILCLFTFPVLYFILYFGTVWFQLWEGKLFTYSGIMLDILRKAEWIWLIGFVLTLGLHVWEMYRIRRFSIDKMECDLNTKQVFAECCNTCKINSDKVKLYQSYQTTMPFVVKIIAPEVIIPVETYSRAELESVFLHELIHLKKRDLLLKRWVSWILIVQWFNPIVWWMSKKINIWCEFACDNIVCHSVDKVKNYVSLLIKMAENANKYHSYLITEFLEEQHQLLHRVEMIHIRRHCKECSNKKAGLICGGILAGSIVMIAGTAHCLAAASVEYYNNTVIEIEEIKDKPELELIEYVEFNTSEEKEIIEGNIDNIERRYLSQAWTINPNTQVKSKPLCAVAGERIRIVVNYDTTHLPLKIGVIEPDGTKRYVTTSNTSECLQQSFQLDQMGNYWLFVENTSSSLADVFVIALIQ